MISSHCQNGNQKINWKSEKHRTLETEDYSGLVKSNSIIDLKGNQNVLKNSVYLKASFERIAKDYIDNDIKCENELEGTSTA